MPRIINVFFLSVAILVSVSKAQSQLTFDGTPGAGSPGVQNGSGAWDLTTANWWDGVTSQNVVWNNNGTTTAVFGTNTSTTGGTVTASGTISVGGMLFSSFSTTPVTSAYTITGGTIQFANNAIVQMNDFTSTGSTIALFVNLNSILTGNNLTIQRDPVVVAGSATFQYIRFAGVNPGLTGTLTLKATSSTRGVFLLTAATNNVSGLDTIAVENGSVFAAGGTGTTYTNKLELAGLGANNGALRIDGNNLTFSGAIKLTADSGILTNASALNTIFSGVISDGGLNYGLLRHISALDSVVHLTAANTYGGTTTLGRAGTIGGGTTILNFTNSAHSDDILYNSLLTPGGVVMNGGTISHTNLVVQGRSDGPNTQRLGAITLVSTRSNIVVTAGSNGTAALSLGTITRSVNTASVGFTVNNGGSITTSTPEGFMGAWATLVTPANGSWAQVVSGGAIIGFMGTTVHTTGSDLSQVAAGSHVRLSEASTKAVSTNGTLAAFSTLSQTDSYLARIVSIGSGNTLRLGTTGGIQIVGTGKSLTIGRPGANPGTLTAGDTAGVAAQLWLTNMSTVSTLTINAQIANNGAGAVSVFINGTGNTVLAGNNTFTGALQLGSGSLEIRHSSALGSATGATTIFQTAALRISGDINSAENISLAGTGIANDGAIRNISGNNTLSGTLTLLQVARIHSDSGTLTLTSPATNTITGTFALTFGGAGNIVVGGRIATSSGTITKEGSGTLVLSGDNTFTGAVTISAGVLRIGSSTALGTSAGLVTISSGAALEIQGSGINLADATSLLSSGVSNAGGIRNVSGDNTISGLITINGVTRINSDSGTLTLDVATGAAITTGSATARTLAFGGAGNILVLDPITRFSGGSLAVSKDGNGTLTLRGAHSYAGTTTVTGGVMELDFSAAGSPAADLVNNGVATAGDLTLGGDLNRGGGTLRLIGKASTANSQRFGKLTVGPGKSFFTVDQNGATSFNVTLGTLDRAIGGVLEITPPTTGTITTTGGADNTILTVGNTPYATYGKSDWAATSAAPIPATPVRNIVGLSSISGGYTASTSTTLSGNADVVATATAVTLASSTTTTSLRFNADADSSLDIGSGNILTTGGILVGEGVGAHTVTISGGTLRSASTGASFTNADFVIIQNNTQGELVISSVIGNNATALSNTSLTKAGAGTLVLETAIHSMTGTTKIMEGTLHIRSGNISPSTQFTLGGGSTSGKLKLGYNTTAVVQLGDWLQIEGSGTTNALVGGGSVLSTFTLDEPGITSDFRKGFIGGAGLYENNLNFRISATGSTLQLGASNTYAGQTIISNGIIEVETLANAGQASSLGTGDFNSLAAYAIIDMADQTTGGTGISAMATLRYTGSTNSTTNRAIRILNSDAPGDIVETIAVLENTGTGTVKFTSQFLAAGNNPATRVLRLAGTNTGANEIVGISDGTGGVVSKIEKTGTGTWGITGANTYSGGTSVSQGTLLAMNTSGSATGLGGVTVTSGGTLGGIGRIAPATGNSVNISGGVLRIGDSTKSTPEAGSLEIATTGGGALTFNNFGWLEFDLVHGAGLGDNAADATSADLLIISGNLVIEPGSVLRIVSPESMIEWAVDDQWKLIDWTNVGTITGSFGILDLPTLSPTLEWDLSKLYTAGTISIMAVPEAGKSMLLLLAGVIAIFRKRR